MNTDPFALATTDEDGEAEAAAAETMAGTIRLRLTADDRRPNRMLSPQVGQAPAVATPAGQADQVSGPVQGPAQLLAMALGIFTHLGMRKLSAGGRGRGSVLRLGLEVEAGRARDRAVAVVAFSRDPAGRPRRRVVGTRARGLVGLDVARLLWEVSTLSSHSSLPRRSTDHCSHPVDGSSSQCPSASRCVPCSSSHV